MRLRVMQIVSSRAVEDALSLIRSTRRFALGAAARSYLRLRHYTIQYLSHLPVSAWSKSADVPECLQAQPMHHSCSGYYEWHDTPCGKQPYHFTRRDADVILIAGI